MDLSLSSEYTYIVPKGDGSPGAALVIDLASIVKSEARLIEVQGVNAHNASELLATFNTSWSTLKRIYTTVQWERNKADLTLHVAEAEALLNVTDDALKLRGHSKGSADLRKAMATVDPKVIKATEVVNEIRAIQDFVHGKMQAFENAFSSVKRLIQVDRLPVPTLHNAPQKSSANPDVENVFGTPRYR